MAAQPEVSWVQLLVANCAANSLLLTACVRLPSLLLTMKVLVFAEPDRMHIITCC